MELTVENIDMETKSPTVVVNKQDAAELGVQPLDRIEIHHEEHNTVGIVDITEELVESGTIGVTRKLDYLSGTVEVEVAPKPDSVKYIRRKLDDRELSRAQIDTIIKDINENRLNDVELSGYVSGIYANNLSMDETVHLTEAMTEIGDTIEWSGEIIADKHSIGGVAGNRVTPIIVPIVAAAGINVPKTSSRAITSPAGTADTVEVLCDVNFSVDEIKEIVSETGGCMVWGGAVNLSPVDDKIIRAEHPLSIDPDGQVLASVLSKKRSAGSTHVVIDIPYGEGSKVDDLEKAREMAYDFNKIGSHLGMEVSCTITRGSEPIGNGVGPVLEARDVLDVLHGEGPEDLKLKSIRLADTLFDLCAVDESATEILESGAALEKFQEIVGAQNGDPDVESDDLAVGDLTEHVHATRSGTVTHINNRTVTDVARRAGAPKDQGAGIYLHKKVGDTVEEDDVLFTIHAENQDKLSDAKSELEGRESVRVRSQKEPLIERA